MILILNQSLNIPWKRKSKNLVSKFEKIKNKKEDPTITYFGYTDYGVAKKSLEKDFNENLNILFQEFADFIKTVNVKLISHVEVELYKGRH